MLLRKWDELPVNMRNNDVKKYYDILQSHKLGLAVKRIFDIVVASIMLIVFSPILLLIAIMIKIDSPGPVMFRQTRVTTYGREFRIFKFRTMVDKADKIGTQVTVKGDSRITRMGKLLRGCRLDELPQLINIVVGEMSFVGTRPEVGKYVACYSNEMMATLLLPAGVTSQASIKYKDEDRLLETAEDVDEVYIKEILPKKMIYNLKSLEEFSFFKDLQTMIETVIAVIR